MVSMDAFADDGGGMDPESIRKCMSLGYSSKKSNSTIGQCNIMIYSICIFFMIFLCILLFTLIQTHAYILVKLDIKPHIDHGNS